MCEKQDDYYNMVERIEDAFAEIDSDICTDLLCNNCEYADLHREATELKQAHPIITELLDGVGPISLTAEEHAEYKRYLALKLQLEDMEREQIYFRGHTDNFAYLKKISAI